MQTVLLSFQTNCNPSWSSFQTKQKQCCCGYDTLKPKRILTQQSMEYVWLSHGFHSYWSIDSMRFTLLANDCVYHPQVIYFLGKAWCIYNEEYTLLITSYFMIFFFLVLYFCHMQVKETKQGRQAEKYCFLLLSFGQSVIEYLKPTSCASKTAALLFLS